MAIRNVASQNPTVESKDINCLIIRKYAFPSKIVNLDITTTPAMLF